VKPSSDLGFVSEYDREFRSLTIMLGQKRLIGLEDDVSFARTPAAAKSAIMFFTLGTALASGEIRREFAKDFGVKPSAVKIGAPTRAGAGDDSVAFRIRIATNAGQITVIFEAVRVGQVDSLFYFAGLPKVKLGAAETKRLAQLAVRRTRSTLAPPANVALPIVAGASQDGQSLTATPGTWANSFGGTALQWQRCDATGGNCADVAGAAGSSYAVAAGDVGMTLRVGEKATNRYGSTAAYSQTTQPVSVAGTPTNTSAPTVSGTAAVGQTLSAAPGSWSDNPVGFAYRWQRCTSQGAVCADIVGAISSTYVVSSADSGATLRVVVTATNAVGPASAASALTAVVK
jgi:hypothetical protein